MSFADAFFRGQNLHLHRPKTTHQFPVSRHYTSESTTFTTHNVNLFHRNSSLIRALPDISEPGQIVSLATATCALVISLSLKHEVANSRIPKRGKEFPNSSAKDSQPSEECTSSNDKEEEEGCARSINDIWTAAWSALQPPSSTASRSPSTEILNNSDQITTPLLWIQGLGSAARRRLLSLSLAALETAIAQHKFNAIAATDSPRDIDKILAEASILAAYSWLGYVPQELKGSMQSLREDKKPSSVYFYALPERYKLYASVIRLVQSNAIIMNETTPAAVSKLVLSKKTRDLGSAPPREATDSVESQNATQASSLDRTTALSMVSYKKNIKLTGWTSTKASGGMRSNSQLVHLAPRVLQDMAVRIADVVAAAYLDEASQGTWNPSDAQKYAPSISSNNDGGNGDHNSYDSNGAHDSGTPAVGVVANENLRRDTQINQMRPLEASWWPSYAHPRLASSTRHLQRFFNRLLLARWVDRIFFSVVATYDDRLPLFTLCAPGPLLRVYQAPVRRTLELASLSGIRYGVSLVLEAVDAVAPALRMLWTRAREAFAWLLTYGIGRGLGLVWRGLKLGLMQSKGGG